MAENHALPPTGSVWAISDTANKSVTFATGLLAAATSDNINPIGLRCCESFGSLLPLCPQTRIEVEQLARRNFTSHSFNFVKASIGYMKGDSVEQLSRSDSGVRFLCLAATLCTTDHYEAALCLDAILEATQKESQLRPTIRQLQVMMVALKTKMILTSFADIVANNEILTRSKLAPLGRQYAFEVAQIPSRSSLQEMILALSQVARIGETTTLDIKLKAQYVPWTWAFIQWSLGCIPTIRTAAGTSIVEQESQTVILTIVPQSYSFNPRKRPRRAADQTLEIAKIQTSQDFREIIFQEDSESRKFAWFGLIPVDTWIRYQLNFMFSRFPEVRDDEKLRVAVGKALYFIIAELPERLVLCDDPKSLQMAVSKQDSGSMSSLFHPTSPMPFLSRSLRVQIVQKLLRKHIDLVEDISEDWTLVPARLAKKIKGACRLCSSEKQNSILAGGIPCTINELYELIGSIGSGLLTITLFGTLAESYPKIQGGQKFHTSKFHHRLFPIKSRLMYRASEWTRLITTGWQALALGYYKYLSCSPITIFKHAASMMGHEKIWDSTIISSKAGQVLYPAFFEAKDFLSEGFMQLCAFPGKLKSDQMQFDFMLDSWSDEIHTQGFSDQDSESVESGEDIENSVDVDVMMDEEVDDTPEHEISASRAAVQSEENSQDESVAASDNEKMSHRKAGSSVRIPNPATVNCVRDTFASSKKRNRVENSGMEWKISVQDELLKGELSIEGKEQVLAWSLVESLARAYVTPACNHGPTRSAGHLGQEFLYVKGAVTMEHTFSTDDRILFDVGGQYSKQLAGLEAQDYYPPTVVHVEGCIRCALQLCLDEHCRVVIS